jgi:hypothetical protein
MIKYYGLEMKNKGENEVQSTLIIVLNEAPRYENV